MQFTLNEEPGTADHDHDGDQARHHIADRRAFGHQLVSHQLCFAEHLILVGEQHLLMLFIGKRLYNADSADIVLNPGVEVPHIAEEVVIGGGHVASEINNYPGHNRYDNKGNDSQLQIDIGHEKEGTDQRHHSDEHILGAVVGHFADVIEVIGNPADQMTGFIVVEEAEGELLDMIEHFFAHIGFNINPKHMPPVGNHVVHYSI
ncbi:hypothetical protein D3C73_1087630 [compost metagenome]